MHLSCNICGGITESFMHLDNIPPLQNRFYETVEKAQGGAVTDVEYMYCRSCDYIMIHKELSTKFDPAYDNSDTASPIMVSRYLDVVSSIKKNCPNVNEKIVEVGCGRGELLHMLKESGYENLKGYDPASPENNTLISQMYWSPTEDSDVDCLIMRHTIEEIPNIKDFLKGCVKSLNVKGKVYCEITNVAELKNISGIFSMYPECHQLFSSLSLSKLFSHCGMSVTSIENIDNGMRLGVWGKKDSLPYGNLVACEMKKLKCSLEKCPKPIIIWGAAGRGGNLLAFLKLDLSIVAFVVDINKEKQGKFIPPFGTKVVSPEDIKWINPKTILVANKKYISEVNGMVPSNCSVLDISSIFNKELNNEKRSN